MFKITATSLRGQGGNANEFAKLSAQVQAFQLAA